MAPNEPSQSLRERRKRETRAQIHAAAIGLVIERGFDAVTVDLISEHAGVSARTFFNYFSTKEAAIIGAVPPLPEDAVQKFLAGTRPREVFIDLAELAISQLEHHDLGHSDFESTMQIVLSVPALARLQFSILVDFEALLAELIATRLKLASDDEGSDLIAAVFMTAVRVAFQRWSRNPVQCDLIDEIRSCSSSLAVNTSRQPVGRGVVDEHQGPTS